MMMLSAIFVTRILAIDLGIEGFGEYSIARRLVATIAPIATVMMGDAIVRTIAMYDEEVKRMRVAVAGMLLGIIPALLFAAIALPLRHFLAAMIFDSADAAPVIAAVVIMVVGYAVYSVCYAICRGRNQISISNIWQIGVMAVAPVAISLIYAESGAASRVVLVMGLSFFAGLVPIAVWFVQALRMTGVFGTLGLTLRELAVYGVPRIPAGIAMMSMLAVTPLVASVFGSIQDAAYLVVGQSVYRVVETALVAFGIVALPKATQLFASGQREYLQKRVGDIVMLVSHVGLFLTLQTVVWSDQIIEWWVGSQYAPSGILMKIQMGALIPYLFFITLRTIIDAVEVRALNALNLAVSLGVMVIGSLIAIALRTGAVGLAMASTISYTLLGVLSCRSLIIRGLLRIQNGRMLSVAALNALLLLLALALRHHLPIIAHSTFLKVTGIVAFELILVAIFFVALLLMRVGWVMQLKSRISF